MNQPAINAIQRAAAVTAMNDAIAALEAANESFNAAKAKLPNAETATDASEAFCTTMGDLANQTRKSIRAADDYMKGAEKFLVSAEGFKEVAVSIYGSIDRMATIQNQQFNRLSLNAAAAVRAAGCAKAAADSVIEAADAVESAVASAAAAAAAAAANFSAALVPAAEGSHGPN